MLPHSARLEEECSRSVCQPSIHGCLADIDPTGARSRDREATVGIRDSSPSIVQRRGETNTVHLAQSCPASTSPCHRCGPPSFERRPLLSATVVLPLPPRPPCSSPYSPARAVEPPSTAVCQYRQKTLVCVCVLSVPLGDEPPRLDVLFEADSLGDVTALRPPSSPPGLWFLVTVSTEGRPRCARTSVHAAQL